MISHGTINLYTAGLLSFLRKVKIEYLDENKNLVSKNIPIMYSSKEKAKSLEFFDSDDFVSGNVNLLPRGTLALVAMAKACAYVQGRNYVIPEDVQRIFVDVAAHRLVLKQKAKLGHVEELDVLTEILEQVATPQVIREERS